MQAQETLKLMRNTMMTQHKSPKSIKSYIGWVARFFAFVRSLPVGLSREDKVVAFLTHLAVKLHVSASTQKQALCSLVFLCKRVLRNDLGDISAFVRSSRPAYIPTVFSREEVRDIICQLEGVGWLWGALMYGCGLRLGEVCALRVKDIDFDRMQVTVKHGKGGKDRNVPLPGELMAPLQKHLHKMHLIWERYARQRVPVSIPDALDRKYPNIPYEWGWFWVFPASEPVREHEGREANPEWLGKLWHVHESAVQKQVGRAIRDAGITKRCGCHTFRHSYATHWLESAEGAHEVALRRLQLLLGHTSPKTTMIYLHTIKQKSDVPSPLDTLASVPRRVA